MGLEFVKLGCRLQRVHQSRVVECGAFGVMPYIITCIKIHHLHELLSNFQLHLSIFCRENDVRTLGKTNSS